LIQETAAEDCHNTQNRGKMNFMICLYKSSIFRLEIFSVSRFILPNHELPMYGFGPQLPILEVLGVFTLKT